MPYVRYDRDSVLRKRYKQYTRKHRYAIRYHGNYCGPGWSAGTYQSSVRSSVPAIDSFDETCKAHDASYAEHGPNREADVEFYRQNIGRGIKRSIAALAVVSQNNPEMPPTRRRRRDFLTPSNELTPPQNPARYAEARRQLFANFPHLRPAETTVVERMQVDVPDVVTSSSKTKMPTGTFGGKFNKNLMSDKLYGDIAKTSSGLIRATETRGNSVGAEIVWFGHATMAYASMLQDSIHALTKLMFRKMQVSFASFQDTVPDEVALFEMQIRYHTASNVETLSSVTSFQIALGSTFQQVGNTLRQLFIDIFAANPDAFPVELRVYSTARNAADNGTIKIPHCVVRLTGMKVYFHARSYMSVQNTTPAQEAGLDLETDNVYATALSGKVYHFNGNYARKIGANRLPVDLTITDYVSGTVNATNNPTDVQPFSEPLDSYNFHGCKGVRRINLDPGEVKSDSIQSFVKTKLQTLWKNYTQRIVADYTHGYGDAHIFALEKRVFIGTPSISVHFNVDTHHAVMLKEGYPAVVLPQTSHVVMTT